MFNYSSLKLLDVVCYNFKTCNFFFLEQVKQSKLIFSWNWIFISSAVLFSSLTWTHRGRKSSQTVYVYRGVITWQECNFRKNKRKRKKSHDGLTSVESVSSLVLYSAHRSPVYSCIHSLICGIHSVANGLKLAKPLLWSLKVTAGSNCISAEVVFKIVSLMQILFPHLEYESFHILPNFFKLSHSVYNSLQLEPFIAASLDPPSLCLFASLYLYF